MSKVEKNCAACGDLIEVRLSDHKRGWGKFCDKQCASAHKSGQRPRDINAYHAECTNGGWAFDRYHAFQRAYPDGKPPKARPIKDQVGKIKVRPTYHSPAICWSCETKINGPGLCEKCKSHEEGLNAIESGWDGHKASLA